MNRRGVIRPFDRDAKGQVLVLFALMLVVLLLMSALAVDYGGWLVARRNYQNVADAASLAGAQQLTRPISVGCTLGGPACAKTAAWESVRDALNFTGLNIPLKVSTPSTPYQENGYSVWVASPPSEAGRPAWLGHVSGPGDVYVRVDRSQASYFSRIVSIGRTVTSWATAGQFATGFAVMAMCRPAAGNNCLAGDGNIKIDGNNSLLALETGDLGTNAWTKTAGNGSAIGLGPDSNAYEEEFNTCWDAGQQCELVKYENGAADYSVVRPAVPLGAPIVDPGYPAPPISATTAPWRCGGTGTVTLAMAPTGGPELALNDVPIQLAAAVAPIPNPAIVLAAGSTVSGTVSWGGTGIKGLTVELMSGTTVVASKTTGNGGSYSMNNIPNGTYTLRGTDTTSGNPPVYNQTTGASFTVSGNTTANLVMKKNPVITGTVRDAATNAVIPNVTITITGSYGTFSPPGTTGTYTQIVPGPGNFQVQASATGYTTNSTPGFTIGLDQKTGEGGVQSGDIYLTRAPANLTVNVTDQQTGAPIANVTVTLTGANSATGTTGTTGSYFFASVSPGSTTITLSGAPITGYVSGSPSNLPNPSTITVAAGPNTANFALWPKGCDTNPGNSGDWSCGFPSGSNCPATTNVDASNVTCTFTQANAIKPGTYNDITLPNNTCAWLDPTGGPGGLAAGQMAGIYHIKGTISLGSNSYLFGDGVTLVMDQGSDFDVNNGGGFVLNYGSLHNTPADITSGCNLSSMKRYTDGFTPCFRTVDDGQDYSYAAWTTAGKSPWQTQADATSPCVQASPPVYNTAAHTTPPTFPQSCVTKGKDLGITFYLNGNGFGNASRFKLATTSMGYLFNGVLYGPRDDIQLGGGKDGQTAAGQIVGWTIEYHGGTRIIQNWYGDRQSGPPFLIEPILGE